MTADPDPDENTGRFSLTRRQAIVSTASIVSVSGAAALSADSGGEGTLRGGAMALDQDYKLADTERTLYQGPDSAKDDITGRDGDRYEAVDTQLAYYWDGGWTKLGHGTASNPVPASHFQSLSTDELSNTELGSTPSNPPTGERKLYAKSDGFYELTSGGTESAIGGGGGTPDTIVSDLAGLKDAINNASDGDYIYIQAGTYTIGGASDQLTLNANQVRIQGDGIDNTIIKLGDGADVKPFQVGTDADSPYADIRISDLTIDGNEANQTDTTTIKHCLEFVDATDITLERVKAIDSHPSRIDDSTGSNGGSGIHVANSCARVRMYSCESHNAGWRGIDCWADDSRIYDPYVVNPDDRGVSFSIRGGTSVTEFGNNVACIGGYVEGGPFPGSSVATFNSSGMAVVGTVCAPQTGKAMVSNNGGDHVTIAGIVRANGASHAGANSHGVRLQNLDHATISSVVAQEPNTGLELTSCNHVSVSGYHVDGTQNGAALLIDGCSNVTVDGFSAFAPENNFFVIRNGSTDIVLGDIVGKGGSVANGHGIYVKGSSTQRVRASNVHLDGLDQNGIEVEGAECQFDGVTIRDTVGRGTDNGINETGTAATNDYTNITVDESEVTTALSISAADSFVNGRQFIAGLADTGKQALARGQAKQTTITVINTSDNTMEMFTLHGGGNTVTQHGIDTTNFTTTEDNDTTVNVYWDSTNTQYELNNEEGASKDFEVHYAPVPV